MRLSYMYHILIDAYNDLTNVEFKRAQYGKEYYKIINNYLLMCAVLKRLKAVDMFIEEINTINDNSFLVRPTSSGEYRINDGQGDIIERNINKIIRDLDFITDFLEKVGVGNEYVGFDVKIPQTDDFNEFAGYINDFQKLVLSCPCLQNKDEKITLKSADLGSIWLCFAVAGAGIVTLTNLTKLIDKAIKIKSHIITCKQQKAQLIAMNQKNELAEEYMGIYYAYKDALINQCADELEEETGQKYDGEDKERLRKSIEVLGELMSKGLELYASIDTPKEIKDLFPTNDELTKLPEQIKLLSSAENDK